MMAKQKKQLILMLVLLVVVIGAYFGLKYANNKEDETVEDTVTYAVSSMTTEQVTKFIIVNDSGINEFNKEGEEWLDSSDTTLDLNESAIETLISKITECKSEDEITGVTDLSIYGLDNPTKTIQITDGTTTETFYVGDYNDTVSKYYLYKEGKGDTVYTADSNMISSFDQTKDDFIAESETDENTNDETEMSNAETEETLTE